MRTCQGCSAPIEPGRRERNKRRWCSEACRVKTHYRQNPRQRYFPRRPIDYATCDYCSKLYVLRRPAQPTDRVCRESECRARHNNDRARELRSARKAAGRPLQHSPAVLDKRRVANSARRAKTRGAERVEIFSHEEIFERDGWKCGICGRRVGKKPWPHPLSASLDHIVPLIEGGDHSRANVRCAHLGCNSGRRDRGGDEQLRLIG